MIKIAPAIQTAMRGGTVRFSVDVVRASNFKADIRIRVNGLPRSIRPSWQRADASRTGVIGPDETGAVLTLRTSGATALGTRRLKLVATSGGRTRTRALSVTVVPFKQRHFSLRVTPGRQIVAQGDRAAYGVRVIRNRRFRGRVRLRVLTLPRGATVAWTPTAMTVATRSNQARGTHRLVVEASSRLHGRVVRRHAVVILSVVGGQPPISGDLDATLTPGRSGALDLVVSNKNHHAIRLIALDVDVRASTSNSGCNGDDNYAVEQYSGGYPLVLQPGSTRLSVLAPDSSTWPRVQMLNLPVNQDACKGAELALDYSWTATR